jgi:rare lipoprotein A
MVGGVAGGALAVDSVALPSQLVRYEEGADATPAAPPSTTTTTAAPPVASTAITTTPVTAARPPTTTTTTAPPPAVVVVAAGHSEQGQATWYAAAPPGRCASPTLPFGTVLTVVNNATGARTVCTVDDREQAGYPRVVDLSPSGFSQLASPSQGVVDVTISW